MKIPEPMIPPITIIVVSNNPSRRARCDSGDDFCAMPSVIIRIELNQETRNTGIFETLLVSQTLGAERANYLSRCDDRRRIRGRRSPPYRQLTHFPLIARAVPPKLQTTPVEMRKLFCQSSLDDEEKC